MEKVTNKRTNGGSVYRSGESLYKFYDDNNAWIDEKKRNVLYFKNNRLIHPYMEVTFFEGDHFLGFSQEYIENLGTFKDGVSDNRLSGDAKNAIVMSVFQKLKTLHSNGILVGDLHADNIIYNDTEGFIVDLDEVRFKGQDDFKFEEMYQIKPDDGTPHIKVASEYTDNVKATVAALSFLYGFDLEDLIIDKVLKVSMVKEWVSTMISDTDFRQDIYRVLDSRDKVIYFDEVLEKQQNNVKK